MINEAVWKSPKWLKRFADFELRTGKDIAPVEDELSKEMKKYLEEKWNSIPQIEMEFFCKRYSSDNNIPISDDFKSNFIYDIKFWKEFDEWRLSVSEFLSDLNSKIIEEVTKNKNKKVFNDTYYYFDTSYGYLSLDDSKKTIKFKDVFYYNEEWYKIIKSTLRFFKERGSSELTALEREHAVIKNKYNTEVATSTRLKKQYDDLKSKFEEIEKANVKKTPPVRKKPDISFQQKIDKIKSRVKEIDSK